MTTARKPPAKRTTKKAAKKPAAKRTTTMKAPTKRTTPKAPAAKKPAKPRKSSGEPRRGRGNLALDVLEVVEKFDSGKLKLPEGKTLTPHAISKALVEADSLEVAPSAGAITNVVKDMQDIGFITVHPKPLAVKAISAAGKNEGYQVLKQKAKDKKAKLKAK